MKIRLILPFVNKLVDKLYSNGYFAKHEGIVS